MKITVNIETNEPADLIRVANALAGVMPDPQTGAADKPKQSRTTKADASPVSSAPTAAGGTGALLTASAGSAELASSQNTFAGADTSSQTASHGTNTDQQSAAAPVTEADLIAGANAAAAKIGPSGPAKVKEWIAATFKCADGTPGKLKLVAEGERPALLRGLQEIAQGVKAV